MSKPHGIVIHGGAGVILRSSMSAEMDSEYRAVLRQSLDVGYGILDAGGASLDAVVAAVRVLENSPLFNAGTGAVLNAEGECELDAAIMDGATLAAGAVAGLKHILNPIDLARAVMDKSAHVLLMSTGAEQFAKESGFELIDNSRLQTERRKRQLRHAKELEGESDMRTPGRPRFISVDENVDRKHGTVGAVALDTHGNLAAGTSTGGLTNKKYGRVGDSPIIGAGTYADNQSCAISATGQGEFFIRATVAHDISARIKYRGDSLEIATAAALRRVSEMGGEGGLIALDTSGNVSMPFLTPGMHRGCRFSNRPISIKLYGDE